MAIAVAVAIRNIPEGMAVSLPNYYVVNDKKKAFIYSALSGVAEPIGAFLILPIVNELTFGYYFCCGGWDYGIYLF